MDGTLLDDKYSFEDASEALDKINSKEVPLVLCSSKTRAEIESYRERLDNKDPFIVEDGGAIFIPEGYFSVEFEHTFKAGNYYVIEIGCEYAILREFLMKLKKEFPEVKGFGDMTTTKLMEDSGLSSVHAKLAKQRGYDEAFKADKEHWKAIRKKIKEEGLHYTEGGKYYHVSGDNDKGKAVEILTKIYKKQFDKIKTISLGDSENDVPMFEKTDKHFKVKGPKDWNKKILKLLE